jgi:DNA repair exonuclease SbcCD ATPase subunit
MKWVAALLCGTAAASQEHPIEKIIALLNGLATKAENEGKEEAVAYTKFEYWCKNSIKTLKKAIAEENDTIDALNSKIDAKTKEKEALEKQITKLEEELGKLDLAAGKALSQRTKTNALYQESNSDLKLTITAVEACITALEGAGEQTSFVQAQVKGVLSLVETSVTEQQRQTLQAFTDPVDVQAMGDRKAHVKKYSFKSGNVIELLKQLLLKFEDDQVQVEKEETNSLNAYSLAKDARDNSIQAATESKTEKENILGEVESELAEAKGDFKDTQDELASDTNTLASTEKSCSVKKSEWAERSEIRANEIAAIEAAVKILAKVGGVRTEAPSNPIPPSSPVSFLQLSSASDDPKMKAVVYLRQQAQVLHAKSLERLAQELSSHLGDPFAEVTNMIEKMIFRLMAEQKDEDDHKNWCDKELEKTDTSISDKKDKITELSAKIDDAQATVNKLTEDIKEANEMVAKIVSFMNEATEIRKVGKKENTLAIKDAEDAQTAVANAIAVLTDFYKSSGEVPKKDWEFVQRSGGVDLPANPDTWDSSYTGVSDPDNQPAGIITILENCNADFAKMEADTRAQEASDQDTYDADMQTHGIEKAKRSKEGEMKTNEKKRLVDKINALTKTKKHVADELEATEQYLADLQPACVDGDSTYEDRKAARTKEIDALHKAQDILAEAFKEGSAFLQRKPIRRA